MLCWHPVWDAGYLSLKPCDRSDVVDTWPVKDASGRQWWFLGPDGGAGQADINGKPVNIRVRRRHLCCHATSMTVQRGAGAQPQCRSGRTQQQQQRQPASPAPAVHPTLRGTRLPPPVCPLTLGDSAWILCMPCSLTAAPRSAMPPARPTSPPMPAVAPPGPPWLGCPARIPSGPLTPCLAAASTAGTSA